MQNEAPIVIDGLTKVFDGHVIALDEFTLEIPRGSTGLLGPNGSGKSTLLKVLLGLVPATSGSALVLGKDPACDAYSIRQHVGYVPENPCLPLDLNSVQICHHFGQLLGMPREQAIQRAHECLNYVGLDDERYRPVSTYSTGMHQRLKLAQALTHDPQVLFIDEPTNGLDPKGRDDMILTLNELRDAGKDMIISSHILPDISQVSDQIAVMSLGRLKRFGDLEDLLALQTQILQIGTDQPEKLQRILINAGKDVNISEEQLLYVNNAEKLLAEEVVRICADADLELRRLKLKSRTLEDIFFEAVSKEDLEVLL